MLYVIVKSSERREKIMNYITQKYRYTQPVLVALGIIEPRLSVYDLVSVSYTHLDVYKRQMLDNGDPIAKPSFC